MSPGRRQQLAQKGGRARAQQLGSTGYSELGSKGGQIRMARLGSEGFSSLGQWGAWCKKWNRLGFSQLGSSNKKTPHQLEKS